jgi:hypothetical protein
MSMLQLFLIQFALQFLVYGTNAECAIGDANENTKWIKSNGRLKRDDSYVDLDDENDDHFLFQVTCSERPDDDGFKEVCNCTFTNSKLQKPSISSPKYLLNYLCGNLLFDWIIIHITNMGLRRKCQEK